MTHNYYELLYAFHIYRHNYRKGEQLNRNLGVKQLYEFSRISKDIVYWTCILIIFKYKTSVDFLMII